MSKGRRPPLFSPMARNALAAALSMMKGIQWTAPRHHRRTTQPRRSHHPEPKWVQDAKIAQAGSKRMRRRARPQGSTS